MEVLKLKPVTTIKTSYPARHVANCQMKADQGKMQEQAELSLKVGIREVVEWVKENVEFKYFDQEEQWKAKRKEWGMKIGS